MGKLYLFTFRWVYMVAGALRGPHEERAPNTDSPLPPSTGAGAEGGSASCCGTDSSSLAAVYRPTLQPYGTRNFSGRSDVVGFDVTRHSLRHTRPTGLRPGEMV